jgi:CheY-like chemotaxis protein
MATPIHHPRLDYRQSALSRPLDETDEDLIMVIEDEDVSAEGGDAQTHEPWQILIADDDHSVHEATVAALAGQKIHGRPLRFLHAYSAAETVDLLATSDPVQLVLLDVVMETPDAGLRAVTEIRERLGCRDLKIIIRTGQPGHAPEQEIRREYAIDGYAKKAELTRSLLRDVIASALQSGDSPSGGIAH